MSQYTEGNGSVLVVGVMVASNSTTTNVTLKLKLVYEDTSIPNDTVTASLTTAIGGNQYQTLSFYQTLSRPLQTATFMVQLESPGGVAETLDYANLRLIP